MFAPHSATDGTLVLSITGVDETTGQALLSRYTYDHAKIRWGHRYVDLLYDDAAGHSHMDYARVHHTEAEPQPPG